MEIFGSNSAREATEKALFAPATLIAKAPVDAAIDLLTFKNPIAGIQNNARTAIGDLALWPFRFTGHVLAGGAKTAAKLGWSAFLNSPLFPAGNSTGKAFLNNPAAAISRFNNSLSAGKSPAEAFSAIAPKQKQTSPVTPPPEGDTEG